MRKFLFLFLIFFVLSGCSLIKFEKGKEIIILNPYKDIKWERVKRYKANLHTHSTKSDGLETPEKVISLYKERGYSILAITDHYYVTFPSVCKKDKMLLIPGAELITERHDILAYFSIKLPEGKGFGILAHPAEYKQYRENIEWYVNLFKKYPNLLGIEIAPGQDWTKIWDGILQRIMPERPVWGFSNDDFHKMPFIGDRWNVFLMEKLDGEEFKNAMKNGEFYVCCRTKPAIFDVDIEKLIVNEKNGEIKIKCKNYKTIQWISDGKVVGYGEKINYKENSEIKKYLRVEIYGENGNIYLNPFGIKNK